MAGAREEKHQFELDGGTVALDFVNTVSGMRASPTRRDRLQGYPDLVYWGEHEVSNGLVGMCEERLVGRCAWLFLDSTRNHSRRYCSMTECGNRAKQRRHYQRAKGAQRQR